VSERKQKGKIMTKNKMIMIQTLQAKGIKVNKYYSEKRLQSITDDLARYVPAYMFYGIGRKKTKLNG